MGKKDKKKKKNKNKKKKKNDFMDYHSFLQGKFNAVGYNGTALLPL